MMYKPKKQVNILTYADCSYLQHASVLLASINDVSDRNNRYLIYLLHTCQDESVLFKVKETIKRLDNHIVVKLKYFDQPLDKRLKSKKNNINDSIYNKLKLYSVLPSNVKKILFIDADVVVKRDPADLYNVNLSGKVLAAVQDYYTKFSEEARAAINLEKDSDYFNSGIMVIDLVKWRESNIEEKAVSFAINKGHLTKLHDQDAFNHAVHGNWLKLSPLWNPRPINTFVNDDGVIVTLNKYQVYLSELAYFNHYSGKDKPWLFASNHPGKKDYLYYLKKTGFSHYKYPDSNLSGLWSKLKNYYKLKRKSLHYKSWNY